AGDSWEVVRGNDADAGSWPGAGKFAGSWQKSYYKHVIYMHESDRSRLHRSPRTSDQGLGEFGFLRDALDEDRVRVNAIDIGSEARPAFGRHAIACITGVQKRRPERYVGDAETAAEQEAISRALALQ